MDIKDKVIIVTGASHGIGKATARLLAEKGAKVVLAARSKDALDEITKSSPDSFLTVQTDMRDPKAIENMIRATMEKFGRIDILINNAGQGIYGAVENTDIAGYRSVIELNVIAPLIAMQKTIPIMRKQGGGMIINISSMVSKAYYPYLGAYASTKYALNALSLTARDELKDSGIIVGVVHPSLTDTDFGANALKSDEMAKNLQNRKRPGMPEPDSPEYIAGRVVDAITSGNAETLAH